MHRTMLENIVGLVPRDFHLANFRRIRAFERSFAIALSPKQHVISEPETVD